MSAITEEGWQKAFKAERGQFEIDNFLPEQENSLREFLGGQNIFVNWGYEHSIVCINTLMIIKKTVLVVQ